MKKEINLPSNFEKSDIERIMIYELNLGRKFKDSLNFLFDKMPNNPIVEDLEILPWKEGKSYRWVVVVDGDLKMLIRGYHTHFTIFTKYRVKHTDDDYVDEYFHTKFGCFTFYTDTHGLDESDEYCDNRCRDLNQYFPKIVEMLKSNKFHFISNSAALPHPKHIEIKPIWAGGETIYSIDNFGFALEELDQKHLEVFSETETLNYLKNYAVGDKLGRYTITRIDTEVKDNYYHAVGVEINKGEGKTEYIDVYRLTRWHWEDFFKTKKDEYNGSVSLDGENS